MEQVPSRLKNAAKSFLIFVYGTLKRGEPNHDVMTLNSNGQATFVGRAKTLDKWPLIIASRFNIPFLLFNESSGHNVLGEVYRIDEHMLETLDEFENHPNYYVRMEKKVQLIPDNENNSGSLTVWIYFLKNYRPSLLNNTFFEEYCSAGSHGLPYVSSEETTDPECIYS